VCSSDLDIGDDEDHAVLLEGATIEGLGLGLDADLGHEGVEQPGNPFVLLRRLVDPDRAVRPDRFLRSGIGQVIRPGVMRDGKRKQNNKGVYPANGNPPGGPARRAEISPNLPEVEQGPDRYWSRSGEMQFIINAVTPSS
jgi:hypothetical protein